ncbi:hypothetical protein KU43P_31460 [Pseudomonas sp. KU43P]|nr:hypothetical protein KU43P_31460 [Pseudomonas sp. KU43P]
MPRVTLVSKLLGQGVQNSIGSIGEINIMRVAISYEKADVTTVLPKRLAGGARRNVEQPKIQ